MLQQLGYGGKSIYITQQDIGVPQNLRDPGYMAALVNLIEAWNACVTKKIKAIFVIWWKRINRYQPNAQYTKIMFCLFDLSISVSRSIEK